MEFVSESIPKTIIQIIGVGGGGTNAVNHMYAQNIQAVQYFVCNTDAYSLEHSPVQYRVQLGPKLTEGLGAGSKPSKGEEVALGSIKDIEGHIFSLASLSNAKYRVLPVRNAFGKDL